MVERDRRARDAGNARAVPTPVPTSDFGAERLPNAERFRGSRPALEVTPEKVARLDGRMGLGFPRAGHARRADLHRSSRRPKAPLRRLDVQVVDGRLVRIELGELEGVPEYRAGFRDRLLSRCGVDDPRSTDAPVLAHGA